MRIRRADPRQAMLSGEAQGVGSRRPPGQAGIEDFHTRDQALLDRSLQGAEVQRVRPTGEWMGRDAQPTTNEHPFGGDLQVAQRGWTLFDPQRQQVTVARGDLHAWHDLDFVAIFRSQGIEAEMEAISIQSVLEANGIACTVIGSSQIPSLPFEVRVPASRLQEATSLLEEVRQAGAEDE